MLFLAMAPAGSKVLAAATKVQNDVGRLAHSGPVRGNFSAAWLKPQADSGAFWTSRAVDRGRLAPLCGQALETHQPPAKSLPTWTCSSSRRPLWASWISSKNLKRPQAFPEMSLRIDGSKSSAPTGEILSGDGWWNRCHGSLAHLMVHFAGLGSSGHAQKQRGLKP